MDGLPFDEIWCCDFEYRSPEGSRPEIRCMVAREVLSGGLLRFWVDDLRKMRVPPFRIDDRALFVAYAADAEFKCFQVLGWPMPKRILDLYVESLSLENGRGISQNHFSLIDTLHAYGLTAIDSAEKQELRGLSMRAGSYYSQVEQAALMEYCKSDVDALVQLLPLMIPRILAASVNPEVSLGQSCLRGRYMHAVGAISHAGIPLDVDLLKAVEDKWERIKLGLVAEVDGAFGVYEGTSFKDELFEAYLTSQGIGWPRLPSGKPCRTAETFKMMTRRYPRLEPLRQLRKTLGQMAHGKLVAGSDGRSRPSLMPFRTVTGRNAPRGGFIFSAPKWMRSFIKSPKDHGLVYVDYSNQEIAVAASLSGDTCLAESYESGDPYLAFGVLAGVIPPDATADSHPAERALLKGCVLALNYGMGWKALTIRLGITPFTARQLIRQHRDAYPTFYDWSEWQQSVASLDLRQASVYGWTRYIDRYSRVTPQGLLNFPMQSNGSEMLRLACCMSTEAGLKICAPIHDAILLEAPLEALDDHTVRLTAIMEEAARCVLKGFTVRAEVENVNKSSSKVRGAVRYPDRYFDKGGERMWGQVMGLLKGCEV